MLETALDNNACSKEFEKHNNPSTNDKVFLLSRADSICADYGFDTNPRANYTRYAWPTDYARAMGVYVVHSDYKACDGCAAWRLRTPGDSSMNGACVSRDGLTYDYNDVTLTERGVRPAIRVNLSAVENCGKNVICTHWCHRDGVEGFLWRLILPLLRLLKISPVCACGEPHYN